jgi:hypothetical protein
MTQAERRRRIAHLTAQANAIRAECWRGYQDLIVDGRTIATAAEIEKSSWRLVCDADAQVRRLSEGLRSRRK